MGILERIITVIKANINHLIGRAEDPEKMLDQMMIDMKDQLMKAKQQVAVAIADEKKLKSQLDNEIEQAKHWEMRAMQAVESNDDGLAKEALARKAEHDSVTEEFRVQWEAQKAAVEKLKDSLRMLNSKIEEAKRKKNLLVAKAKRSQAQQKIHETMAGLNDTSAFETFDRMQDKVNDLEAKAQAAEEINEEVVGDQLEKKFEKLSSASSVSVDSALAELKAKMGKSNSQTQSGGAAS